MPQLAYKLVYALAVMVLAACASLPNAQRSAREDQSAATSVPAPSGNISQFDSAIAAFEAADRQAMPPPCSFLFVGSSSIRFWRTLGEDFPDRTVINRGFGGSTIAEVNHYFDRIVAPYKPRAIVLYAGENDLNSGRPAEAVAADFGAFMKLKDRSLGSTPVWFISAKPSKLRSSQMDAQTELNARIKAMADRRDDLAFIDVVQAMLGPGGLPKDIFLEDNLHMTQEGYRIWTPIIDAALDADQEARAPDC